MKGDPKVINQLNARLADELAAVNQYMVHAEMCENWGYKRLHEVVQKRAIDEMKHAEKLIARILFLEGIPIVSQLSKIQIGPDVARQYDNDLKAELAAVKDYNADIRLAEEASDQGTKELLISILKDEEAHIDWLEAQLEQIKQMGIQIYLTEQTK